MQFGRLSLSLNLFTGFDVVRSFPHYGDWNGGIETVMVDHNRQ